MQMQCSALLIVVEMKIGNTASSKMLQQNDDFYRERRLQIFLGFLIKFQMVKNYM